MTRTYKYTGNEPSPKGLGIPARHHTIGKILKGRDKRPWIVDIKKNHQKYWKQIRSPTRTRLGVKSFLMANPEIINTEEDLQVFLKEKKTQLRYALARILARMGLGPKDLFNFMNPDEGCVLFKRLLLFLGKKLGKYMDEKKACHMFVETFHNIFVEDEE